eukprot:gb/GFBE01040922.1/.p1 GENE.gb/GFBE01040922.1/~~gb/GFBE01040922.1/.p1  ORF type:complete len:383 (+),score=37.57 gb/GFBE01040922.1/:1-1149(+)
MSGCSSDAEEDECSRMQPAQCQGCKPCNRYFPIRPCLFCDTTHERPKHRGQRGRHALQRRQYLESRVHRHVVDNVCEVLPPINDEIKKMRSPSGDLPSLLASRPHVPCSEYAATCRGHHVDADAIPSIPRSVGEPPPTLQRRRGEVLSGMVAFLIAIQTYQNFTNLQCPLGDIDRVEQVLQHGSYEVYRAVDLNERDVVDPFRCLSSREIPPKQVLVYWSSHSEQWGVSNRLMCSDTVLDWRSDQSPTVNYILREIVKATSCDTRVIFILDGCRGIANAMPPLHDDSMPRRGQCWVMYACASGCLALEGFEDKTCSDFNTEFVPWLRWQLRELGKLEISSNTFAVLRDAVMIRTMDFQRPELLQSTTRSWNDDSSSEGDDDS